MGRKLVVDQNRCKLCKKVFDQDPNPLVKKDGKGDELLRRRAPHSRDCKPCSSFFRNEDDYSEMTAEALEAHLENPANQAEYDRRFDEWCEARREGKRRARSRGCIEVATTSARTAKQTSLLGEGGEEDGNQAADAFEAATKKLRVSTTDKDDEIILSLAKFRMILFGVGRV
eukprot:s191_g18.t1